MVWLGVGEQALAYLLPSRNNRHSRAMLEEKHGWGHFCCSSDDQALEDPAPCGTDRMQEGAWPGWNRAITLKIFQ